MYGRSAEHSDAPAKENEGPDPGSSTLSGRNGLFREMSGRVSTILNTGRRPSPAAVQLATCSTFECGLLAFCSPSGSGEASPAGPVLAETPASRSSRLLKK